VFAFPAQFCHGLSIGMAGLEILHPMPSLPQREAEGVKALRPLRGDRVSPVGLDALGLLR